MKTMQECINTLVKDRAKDTKELEPIDTKAENIGKKKLTRKNSEDRFYLSNLADFESDHSRSASQATGNIGEKKLTRKNSEDIFYLSNLADFESDHNQGASQASQVSTTKSAGSETSKSVESETSSKNSIKRKRKAESTPIVINSDDERSDDHSGDFERRSIELSINSSRPAPTSGQNVVKYLHISEMPKVLRDSLRVRIDSAIFYLFQHIY